MRYLSHSCSQYIIIWKLLNMLAIHLNFKYQIILIINKLKYEKVQNQLKHDTKFEPTLNTLSSEAASPLSFDSTLIR